MAHRKLAIALGMIAAASPVSVSSQQLPPTGAPAGTPDTQYCLRIEAVTGSRVERVKCLTREEWAEAEVDVDKEWAEEGVAIITNGVRRPVDG